MSSTPDLKIVDEDIQALHRDLKTVSDAFAEDTHVADDIGVALGHTGLAKRFADFSESWRVNRERMQKNINELADQMGNIKVATDEVDTRLSGGESSAPQNDGSTPSSANSDAPLPSSPTHNVGVAGTGDATATLAPASPSAAPSTSSDPGTTSDSGGSALPDSTDPTQPMVRVGEDGDFYAAVTVGGASAAGATATLMALYKLWDAHRAQRTGQPAVTAEATQADARSRLLAGLEQLSGDGRDVSVELVSDGRSPDQITAILKSEDGSVSVIDLSSDGGDPVASDAVGADTGSVPEAPSDPTTLPDQLPDPSASAPGGDGNGGAATEPPAVAPAADLPSVTSPETEPGASAAGGESSLPSAGEPVPAVNPTPQVNVDAGSSSSGPGADSALAAGAQPAQTAGSSAAVGMAGMGAMSMAGMGSQASAPAPSRSQSEPLRKVAESSDDESAKGKDR